MILKKYEVFIKSPVVIIIIQVILRLCCGGKTRKKSGVVSQQVGHLQVILFKKG